MPVKVQFQILPEQSKDDVFIRRKIQKELKLKTNDFHFYWHKRSIDARQKVIKMNCSFDVYQHGEERIVEEVYFPRKVEDAPEVAIIGFGPAGIFAALHAIEKGLKPIIFERGTDVRSRRRDLAKLNKESIVNPESNYCFGEGGAGTYSDGKLYTRSKKRGNVKRALEWFVHFGADRDILIDAHPHIGTNKLPQIIVAMRETIIEMGGEVHFNSKMTDIVVKNGVLTELEINHDQKYSFENVILATGHSARDVFELLHKKNIQIHAKPFALGIRIEHQQSVIDQLQYHGRLNDEFLPPASYSLVTQVNGRGVYSFCMCPGGIVAPCSTEQEEVVTNGWSPSKRNNPFSNSGIVVEIHPEDFDGHEDNPFVCLDFQKTVERKCWEAAGSTQKVPGQRIKDFLDNKVSKDLPKSSYQPGVAPVNLKDVLPELITNSLHQAFLDFDQKMKGFIGDEVMLHAPESRTSSPIQIPRDETLQHPDVIGLYPCAEGAGYAGGIVSAAIDGMKCIEKIVEKANRA